MRVPVLPIALVLGAAVPAAAQTAAAQATATPPAAPTVEQYLCTFAGKCDGAASTDPTATRDAPETRGFRIARPTDTKPTAPTVVTTRGHDVVGRRLGRTPRQSYAAATRPAVTGAATPAAAMTTAMMTAASMPAHAVAAGARPRADLMIGFELNSDRLSAEGMGAARTFARSLQMPELQSKRFLIEGHTDLRGGRAINAGLSARRAQAVTDFLVGEGVSRDRLQARGFGASAPLPGHRATDPANRRVEAELIS